MIFMSTLTIMAYLSKARIRELEKPPLLSKGCVTFNNTRAIAKQRTHSTTEELNWFMHPVAFVAYGGFYTYRLTEELLEAVFSVMAPSTVTSFKNNFSL
jgi:hypothetical protein